MIASVRPDGPQSMWIVVVFFFMVTLLLPGIASGLLAEKKGRRFWPWALGGGVGTAAACLLLVALLNGGNR